MAKKTNPPTEEELFLDDIILELNKRSSSEWHRPHGSLTIRTPLYAIYANIAKNDKFASFEARFVNLDGQIMPPGWRGTLEDDMYSITLRADKGPSHIAKAITSRLLPEYIEEAREKRNEEREEREMNELKANILKPLLHLYGWDADPSRGIVHASSRKNPSYLTDYLSKIEIEDDMLVTLTINQIPYSLSHAIAEALLTSGHQKITTINAYLEGPTGRYGSGNITANGIPPATALEFLDWTSTSTDKKHKANQYELDIERCDLVCAYRTLQLMKEDRDNRGKPKPAPTTTSLT